MTKNRTPTPVYLDPSMHSGLEVKGLTLVPRLQANVKCLTGPNIQPRLSQTYYKGIRHFILKLHFALFYFCCVAIDALIIPYNLISESLAHCLCVVLLYLWYAFCTSITSINILLSLLLFLLEAIISPCVIIHIRLNSWEHTDCESTTPRLKPCVFIHLV